MFCSPLGIPLKLAEMQHEGFSWGPGVCNECGPRCCTLRDCWRGQILEACRALRVRVYLMLMQLVICLDTGSSGWRGVTPPEFERVAQGCIAIKS